MEMRKALVFCTVIKEMKDKKATWVMMYLGMCSKCRDKRLTITTQLINNINEFGNWPKDLIEVTFIALEKKPKATKRSDYRTVNFIKHTVNSAARILKKD